MGEVLQGGEEKEGYRGIQSRTADLMIVHNHIYRHCPPNLAVQSTELTGSDIQGQRGVQAQTWCQCSSTFDIPFPCSFCQDPLLVGGNSCGGHTATKAFGFLQSGHQSSVQCSAEFPTPVLRNKGQPHNQHCPHELPPLATLPGH